MQISVARTDCDNTAQKGSKSSRRLVFVRVIVERLSLHKQPHEALVACIGRTCKAGVMTALGAGGDNETFTHRWEERNSAETATSIRRVRCVCVRASVLAAVDEGDERERWRDTIRSRLATHSLFITVH